MQKGNIKELKVNQEISAQDVYLIDQDGQSQGKVSLDQAMLLAFEAGLDLVEVNAGKDFPITKIMDYGKYRYSQEKLLSKQKSKSKGPDIKEIRLSFKINQHDLDFKIKQAQKFLNAGDKVKVVVKLVGREMMYSQKVTEIINDFKLKAGGKVEGPLERLGSRFSATLIRNNNETKNS